MNKSAGWIITEGELIIDDDQLGFAGTVHSSVEGLIPSYKETTLYMTAIGYTTWYCIAKDNPEQISVVTQNINSDTIIPFNTHVVIISGTISSVDKIYNIDDCIDAMSTDLVLKGYGKVLLITKI